MVLIPNRANKIEISSEVEVRWNKMRYLPPKSRFSLEQLNGLFAFEIKLGILVKKKILIHVSYVDLHSYMILYCFFWVVNHIFEGLLDASFNHLTKCHWKWFPIIICLSVASDSHYIIRTCIFALSHFGFKKSTSFTAKRKNLRYVFGIPIFNL